MSPVEYILWFVVFFLVGFGLTGLFFWAVFRMVVAYVKDMEDD
jgi:hypothetical protein